MFLWIIFFFGFKENEASAGESGSDPPSDEAEDLDEEEEFEDLRPAKRPRHGGFIIEEAGELEFWKLFKEIYHLTCF